MRSGTRDAVADCRLFDWLAMPWTPAIDRHTALEGGKHHLQAETEAADGPMAGDRGPRLSIC